MSRIRVCSPRTSIILLIFFGAIGIIAIFKASYFIDSNIELVPSDVEEEKGVYPGLRLLSKNLTLGNGEVISYKVYPQMNVSNNANMIYTGCSPISNRPGSTSAQKGVVVLTNFMLFSQKDENNLSVGTVHSHDNDIVNARVMEVIDVLYKNLLHPSLAELHVLVGNLKTAEFLKRLPLKNTGKLFIKVEKDDITMKVQLLYAGNCLKDKIVAVAHQDNLFGEGWGKIEPDILQRQKIMYALTRHSSEKSCSGSRGAANCDPGYPYIGSHDVFAFHVKEAFTADMLNPMDNITPNLHGMENVLIWMFKEKLGYTVINPCPILFVHHQHCISIRDKGRKRVNTKETTGMAGFTNQLDK